MLEIKVTKTTTPKAKPDENNLGFLSANSKKGSSLVNELNQKVEKLKADLNLVVEKIKLIDDAIKEKEGKE